MQSVALSLGLDISQTVQDLRSVRTVAPDADQVHRAVAPDRYEFFGYATLANTVTTVFYALTIAFAVAVWLENRQVRQADGRYTYMKRQAGMRARKRLLARDKDIRGAGGGKKRRVGGVGGRSGAQAKKVRPGKMKC